MTIVLSTCDRDIKAALRLVKWIGFLSQQMGNSMLREKFLLVASQRATRYPHFKPLCWLAARIFGEARCHVPDHEHEVGWPGAANWMFKQCLEHVEANFPDDILFLEPDVVMVRATWFDEFKAEWQIAKDAGRSFLGALVPHNVTHMTGIAVYPANWREVAPRLAQCPDHDAWDCYAAPEVLPRLQQTNLIQHVFRRHDPGWAPPHVGILDRRAALFHQDKKGALIHMLDAANFNGECIDHPLFGFRNLAYQERVMRKFYYAANATMPKSSHGITIAFDKLDPFGGAIPGAFTTELENEQIALADLTSNPTTGVSEITQEEYEALTKKKLPPPPSSTLNPWSNSGNKVPSAAILPTPSKSPAVLVAESSSHGSEIDQKQMTPLKDIGDVVKVETIVPSQPVIGAVKSARPRKPSGSAPA